MKKLFIILFSLGIAAGASAQGHWRGGASHVYVHPRTTVRIGAYAPYGYYGYGYPFGMAYGYPWYGNPYYDQEYMPSKLQLEIQDIKNDYKDRIWSARHDKSLSKADRRNEIHQLKSERDRAIIDAQRNYYRSPNQ